MTRFPTDPNDVAARMDDERNSMQAARDLVSRIRALGYEASYEPNIGIGIKYDIFDDSYMAILDVDGDNVVSLNHETGGKKVICKFEDDGMMTKINDFLDDPWSETCS